MSERRPPDLIMIVMWMLVLMVVVAAILALVTMAQCWKLNIVPCAMPGLQQFASDAIASMLGLAAGRYGKDRE